MTFPQTLSAHPGRCPVHSRKRSDIAVLLRICARSGPLYRPRGSVRIDGMVGAIRTVAAIAAVAFLAALVLRDLSIVQFSDGYLLPCTAAVATLGYAAQAARAWRVVRKRPNFRKVRWLLLAVSGPTLMFFVPWFVFFLLLMMRAPLDTSVGATLVMLLVGGALSIYNLICWHRQASTTTN